MSRKTLKIDFVSDVSCPWCIIGLKSLEQAASALKDELDVELHFQPFELNPQMPPDGEAIDDHLARKYGLDAAQLARNQEAIRVRGAQLGFIFNMQDRRIYNTFDAHRLLHWAQLQGAQAALKHALFKAYFTDGLDISDPQVLCGLALDAGLDGAGAKAVLDSDRFAVEVRAREQFYAERGIRAVPAIVIDEQHLIAGGQPPEVFAQVLRQLAAA